FAAFEWWKLAPAPELIRNQPGEFTRRTVLARVLSRDFAVAYLPDNEWVEIDLSTFSAPVAARWFDPVHGRFAPTRGIARNEGTHRFAPPAKGEWVLVLEPQVPTGQNP
ncbi:MAG: hypothetical protein FJ399_21730, partial [Verrucomicrobia bacterium]|nr:hypothetical protein [Verrucomicrobiota bacterium]